MAGHSSSAERIVLVATELILRSRVEERLRALGYEVSVADTAQGAREALRASPVLLVLDLQVDGIPWQQVVAAAEETCVPVLAYGQHTKPSILRAARAAGCDLAVPRSKLVAELPALLQRVRDR
jgi:DNA-binding response OmpR family regulator